MMLEKNEFRRVMGMFATGVTVVTIDDSNGRPYGFVVNAFTSVSLEPPEILICVDRKVTGHSYFVQGKFFAVHVLRSDQDSLCRHFLRKDINRFEGLITGKTLSGAPLIHGILAVLECRLVYIFPAGDHDIMVGTVTWTKSFDGLPLLFYRGEFRSLETQK